MRITVNGKEEHLPRGMDVEAFLQSKGVRLEEVVVELNREIIAREKWRETIIKENDNLEILHFMGGGK